MVYLGVDWAEAHHDLCLLDGLGEVLGRRRVPEGVEGLRLLHELVGMHTENGEEVVVGIETDRGLFVEALVTSGYAVYAINPLAASRYRDRHTTSRAKSDAGDAKMLADLVRTDRHNHRPVSGDSEQLEAVKVLARAHRTLSWSRQRAANQLRSALREFYPAALEAFGEDLTSIEAVSILEQAPTPLQGRGISRSKISATLRRAGRQRRIEASAERIQNALRSDQLEPGEGLSQAYGIVVVSTVRLIRQMNSELIELEGQLRAHFEVHPDAEIYRSLPGLGFVLGARVLAEFGDDRTRFANAKARKNYAGTAPITRASGTRLMVLSRMARNRWLNDACYLWAFTAICHSPGARRYYDQLRARHKSHNEALRAVGNRLVGILHGCLAHRCLYQEDIAWPILETAA